MLMFQDTWVKNKIVNNETVLTFCKTSWPIDLGSTLTSSITEFGNVTKHHIVIYFVCYYTKLKYILQLLSSQQMLAIYQASVGFNHLIHSKCIVKMSIIIWYFFLQQKDSAHFLTTSILWTSQDRNNLKNEVAED